MVLSSSNADLIHLKDVSFFSLHSFVQNLILWWDWLFNYP